MVESNQKKRDESQEEPEEERGANPLPNASFDNDSDIGAPVPSEGDLAEMPHFRS